MTTRTFGTTIAHTSTATFQAWGSEISSNLSAGGCIQTADTGQINWSTVAYTATTNAAQGYEIWKFPDSSLYFKLEYGTGTTATTPAMWITAGTGSNGSGTIAGTQTSRVLIGGNAAPVSTTIAYPSYMSITNNAVMFAWKVGAYTAGGGSLLGFFLIGKSSDNTGASTTAGFSLIYPLSFTTNNGGMTMQPVRITTTSGVPASQYTANNTMSLIPGAPASTILNGSYQTYPVWTAMPDVQIFPWAVAYLQPEAGTQQTITVTPAGSTSHTYITLGGCTTNYGPAAAFATANMNTSGIAFIYE